MGALPVEMGSQLKADVFRPTATLIVPGATAAAPYILVAATRYHAVRGAIDAYPVAAGLVLFFVAIAAGLVLEDLGSIIESQIWDKRIDADSKCQDSDWDAYLLLEFDKEPVGQRYLRTMTLRLKFELSFGLALIASWLGGLWLDANVLFLSERGVLIASIPLLSLAAYLLWESGKSAWVLADVRHLLVHGSSFPSGDRPKEPDPWASRLDWSLAVLGSVALVSSLGLYVALSFSGLGFERFAGTVSLTLAALFGLVLIASRAGKLDGVRRATAKRVSYASGLAATLVAIRLLDRGSYLLGWVGLVGALAYTIWFAIVARRLAPQLLSQAQPGQSAAESSTTASSQQVASARPESD